MLRTQLEQAQKDMDTLQELKREALAAPKVFVERLSQGTVVASERQYKQQGQDDADDDQEPSAHDEAPTAGSPRAAKPLRLPALQKVALLPNINLRPWLGRLPRRATTKYDQNLGIHQTPSR